MSDAVLVVEYRAIHHGIGALDRMLKRAGVGVLHAGPICIGKYLICLGGDVADVEAAEEAAREMGAPLASYLLTGAHPSILSYFRSDVPHVETPPAAVGIVETGSTAAGFRSLDQARKGAQTGLLRLWLGHQLGGKLCYVLGGATSDVQSAMQAAQRAISPGELVGTQLVLSPLPDTLRALMRGGGPHRPAGKDL